MAVTEKSETLHVSIVKDFARWTALSALRQGSIRSKKDVYSALATLDLDAILDRDKGSITQNEFDTWHQQSLLAIVETPGMNSQFGWAAKIINVYLKTAVYVGGLGRENLVEFLHPPIDSGLWKGLRAKFDGHPALALTHQVWYIKDIKSLGAYHVIIGAMRALAEKEGCLLIELEQFWDN